MPNPKINNINVGGVDYDIGSTVLSFDTYDDYLDAHEAGDIPVGSTVFIKEGNQSLITANQVSYGNSNVEAALDRVNASTSAHVASSIELALKNLINSWENNGTYIGRFKATSSPNKWFSYQIELFDSVASGQIVNTTDPRELYNVSYNKSSNTVTLFNPADSFMFHWQDLSATAKQHLEFLRTQLITLPYGGVQTVHFVCSDGDFTGLAYHDSQNIYGIVFSFNAGATYSFISTASGATLYPLKN